MSAPDRRPLLFITHKYPPSRGGMEEFSIRLFEAFPRSTRLIALRGSQARFPAWLPAMLARTAAHRRDVGHVHLGSALLTLVAPLIERAAGAPVTATLHGLDVTNATPGYRPLLRRALRRMDGRLIAVSRYTAEQAHAIAGVTPAVIANGIDAPRFGAIAERRDRIEARRRLGLALDVAVIATVGRLVRRKGVHWFVEDVLPLLDAPLVYVVAGDGPNRARVDAAAARDDRVRVLGDVSDATVDALLEAADLFVTPNVRVPDDPEGYGLAAAEAAAAGVPVLAADLEGLRDAAEVCGFPLVASGDTGAWADAVRRALLAPGWALAKHPPRGWDAVAADYAALFASIGPPSTGRPRHRSRPPA